MAFARGLELTKEGSLTRRSRRDGSIAALATTKRPSILYARSVSLTALKGCSYITHGPFMGDFLMVSTERTSDPLGVGARIKIAPVEQFLTQVTTLLACELVTTTRYKCYKGGDRSELANLMSL